MRLLVLLLAFAAMPLLAGEARTLVVMDPLSKPLSCDCVKGYAQRDYEKLRDHLAAETGDDWTVVWYESLATALKETGGKADLVVGKHSVVLADEKSTGHALTPVMSMTSQEGETTQHGVFAVRAEDAAKSLADLEGYRVFFGPADAAEKSAAPEAALKAAGVTLTGDRERFNACSEAATALVELPEGTAAAAVISSYAEPLLEGCGAVKKGDLRVVGKSGPVPFVVAFTSDKLTDDERKRIAAALESVADDPELMLSLETLGYVPFEDAGQKKSPVAVK